MSKPMRLSEAIIKGCEGTCKVILSMRVGRIGYCVTGAALRGIGAKCYTAHNFIKHFPLASEVVTHPETGERKSVILIMEELNDWQKWPRLSIAEWIANVVEPEFHK